MYKFWDWADDPSCPYCTVICNREQGVWAFGINILSNSNGPDTDKYCATPADESW